MLAESLHMALVLAVILAAARVLYLLITRHVRKKTDHDDD